VPVTERSRFSLSKHGRLKPHLSSGLVVKSQLRHGSINEWITIPGERGRSSRGSGDKLSVVGDASYLMWIKMGFLLLPHTVLPVH
jgi:hypothetical protein